MLTSQISYHLSHAPWSLVPKWACKSAVRSLGLTWELLRHWIRLEKLLFCHISWWCWLSIKCEWETGGDKGRNKLWAAALFSWNSGTIHILSCACPSSWDQGQHFQETFPVMLTDHCLLWIRMWTNRCTWPHCVCDVYLELLEAAESTRHVLVFDFLMKFSSCSHYEKQVLCRRGTWHLQRNNQDEEEWEFLLKSQMREAKAWCAFLVPKYSLHGVKLQVFCACVTAGLKVAYLVWHT
jgi:hypothetical protein